MNVREKLEATIVPVFFDVRLTLSLESVNKGSGRVGSGRADSAGTPPGLWVDARRDAARRSRAILFLSRSEALCSSTLAFEG